MGDGVIVITRAVGGAPVALLSGFNPIKPLNPIKPHTPSAAPSSGPSHQIVPLGRRARAWTRRTACVVESCGDGVLNRWPPQAK
jgi:hypothetical protein